MMKLFIASNNKHKIEEIKDIFDKNFLEVEIFSPSSFDDHDEPIEDGLSFEENALIKARYFYDKYHLPTIGEDSGICIDYFNGKPGIYSKRFLGQFDDPTKNEKILELMKDVKNRKARFVTALAFIDENNSEFIFNGINEGEIALEAKGSEGFGYDPIFLIPQFNKTEAELGLNYKGEFSHRARALKEFIKYVKQNY